MNDVWVMKMGIIAYMRKEKRGETELPSQEEIDSIRNKYTKETVFYTEPIEEEVKEIAQEITVGPGYNILPTITITGGGNQGVITG